jgi:hypothetical protein
MTQPEKKHDRNKFDIGYQDYLDGRLHNPFGTNSIAAQSWNCGAEAAMMDWLAEVQRGYHDLKVKGLITPELEEWREELLTSLRKLASEDNVIQLKLVGGSNGKTTE